MGAQVQGAEKYLHRKLSKAKLKAVLSSAIVQVPNAGVTPETGAVMTQVAQGISGSDRAGRRTGAAGQQHFSHMRIERQCTKNATSRLRSPDVPRNRETDEGWREVG